MGIKNWLGMMALGLWLIPQLALGESSLGAYLPSSGYSAPTSSGCRMVNGQMVCPNAVSSPAPAAAAGGTCRLVQAADGTTIQVCGGGGGGGSTAEPYRAPAMNNAGSASFRAPSSYASASIITATVPGVYASGANDPNRIELAYYGSADPLKYDAKAGTVSSGNVWWQGHQTSKAAQNPLTAAVGNGMQTKTDDFSPHVNIGGQLYSRVPVKDFASFQASMQTVTPGLFKDGAGRLYEKIDLSTTSGVRPVFQQVVVGANGPQGTFQPMDKKTREELVKGAIAKAGDFAKQFGVDGKPDLAARAALTALEADMKVDKGVFKTWNGDAKVGVENKKALEELLGSAKKWAEKQGEAAKADPAVNAAKTADYKAPTPETQAPPPNPAVPSIPPAAAMTDSKAETATAASEPPASLPTAAGTADGPVEREVASEPSKGHQGT